VTATTGKSMAVSTSGHPMVETYVIPPERRRIVRRCSDYCRSCQRWTRSGGGCPGVSKRNISAIGPYGETRERPLCHSDERAMWEPIVEAATATN